MAAKPQSAPQRPADSGVSISCLDDAYLNGDIPQIIATRLTADLWGIEQEDEDKR